MVLCERLTTSNIEQTAASLFVIAASSPSLCLCRLCHHPSLHSKQQAVTLQSFAWAALVASLVSAVTAIVLMAMGQLVQMAASALH